MWRHLKPNRRTLRAWQLVLLVAIFGLWHLLTVPGLLPHFLFSDDNQAAFFFGEPSSARCTRRWAWPSSGRWWASTSARPKALAT